MWLWVFFSTLSHSRWHFSIIFFVVIMFVSYVLCFLACVCSFHFHWTKSFSFIEKCHIDDLCQIYCSFVAHSVPPMKQIVCFSIHLCSLRDNLVFSQLVAFDIIRPIDQHSCRVGRNHFSFSSVRCSVKWWIWIWYLWIARSFRQWERKWESNYFLCLTDCP